jgi:hypothetical protein
VDDTVNYETTTPDKDEQVEPREKKLLEEALERWQAAAEATAEQRRVAKEDLEFRAGEQWPSDIKAERSAEKRPCLTINKLPQFSRQITNEQRKNRPAIKISPVSDGADEDTAEVLQGAIRHIEQLSNADVAYDTAFKGAVDQGFGYFRFTTAYTSSTAFTQEIQFKRIRNPFTVYLDPSAQEPDGSDANWGFVVEDLSKETYKRLYPKSKRAIGDTWETSVGDNIPDWVTKDGCRVAEYFYKKFEEVTLVLLSDGAVFEKAEYEALMAAGQVPLEITKVDERQATKWKVMWCKHTATEILEETEWLGKYIPIVPVYGDELDVDGKVILEGIIRHAKDPQRMYNYWATAETETIALSPKAPWVGAEGQFEGNNKWETANTKNHAYLEYKPKSLAGVPLPPPQRNTAEPPVQAITNARLQATDDLKATTGIYDATLGARSNERSGRAITARDNQSQTSNFHFIDNLVRSVRHAGRILIDLIPKVYDAPQIMRIIGEDGSQRMVKVNQKFIDPKTKVEKIFDFSVGVYDVIVEAGPSFSTKRKESAESILSLAQSYPQLMEIAGDLLVQSLDWPEHRKIAQRLRKMLPPGVAEPLPGEEEQMPPAAIKKINEMQEMIKQLTATLNDTNQQLETKQAEIASKEKIAFAQMKTSLVETLAKIESSDSQHELTAHLKAMENQLDALTDLAAQKAKQVEKRNAAH